MSDALFVIIILAVIFGISGFGSALKEVDKEERKRKRERRRLLSSDIKHEENGKEDINKKDNLNNS